MKKLVITNAHAPNPLGAYNQGVIVNNFVFTSGQIPIDPDSGKIIDGSFKDRVNQVFKNISAILEKAGTDITQAVKFTVFLTDMKNYGEVNEVFNKWLDEAKAPARSLVAVCELPGKADIEIECVALVSND